MVLVFFYSILVCFLGKTFHLIFASTGTNSCLVMLMFIQKINNSQVLHDKNESSYVVHSYQGALSDDYFYYKLVYSSHINVPEFYPSTTQYSISIPMLRLSNMNDTPTILSLPHNTSKQAQADPFALKLNFSRPPAPPRCLSG